CGWSDRSSLCCTSTECSKEISSTGRRTRWTAGCWPRARTPPAKPLTHRSAVALTAQRTLVLLRPDAVQRGRRAAILRRIEAQRYETAALSQRTATAQGHASHHAEHGGKPFYPGLVEYMGSPPLVALSV